MVNNERVEARNVSMYAADWKIVETADKSNAGISATLRRIVREWREQQMVTIETLPMPRDEIEKLERA